MKFDLVRVLSSKVTTMVLFALYIVMMATATFIEKYYGTPEAKSVVYYSPLFVFLQLLMIVNFIIMTMSYGLFTLKKVTYAVVHLSLIVILCGAMATHLFSKEGIMHLREGERSAVMLLKQEKGNVPYELPFEIELKDFVLTRYPGSQSPSSYESYLQIYVDGEVREEKVYMNNVLDLKGYRFFQASYDRDEKGTILSVNYDVAGRIITYIGYALLFAGLILTLIDPRSRFRRLWKTLGDRFAVLFIVMLVSTAAVAENNDVWISREHAEKFGRMPVLTTSGRVVPMSTLSSEIVRKFKADKIIGEMSPEQFVISVMAYPMDWSVIPLIRVKDESIAQQMGWNTGRISYRDAFDTEGKYILADAVEKVYLKLPSERTRQDKQILKIDDRLNIFHALITHRMLRVFPDKLNQDNKTWLASGEIISMGGYEEIKNLSTDYVASIRTSVKSGNWEEADRALTDIMIYQSRYSEEDVIDMDKIKAEDFYNKFNLLKLCKICYLILGLIMIILSFVVTQKGKPRDAKKTAWKIVMAGVILAFILQTVSLALRWYISGHAPWANSYETMVFLSWAGIVCGFVFARRNRLVTALATMFGGIILFVSGLSWMDPQITPLVPVLKSPWLMSHVASLVMAYGFLGICCMVGTTNLLLSLSGKENIKRLTAQMTVINELSMQLGVALLTVGIFLGAIWANESWGRYWSWDPKETWALITMVLYTADLHFIWFDRKKRDLIFNFLSQISFLAILMTFLGVNYFLSGMHSYGSHDALAGIPIWGYALFFILFILPGVLSLISYKHKNKKEQIIK